MASFGENLRRERELRGIELREMADATKISIRFLQALEQDRVDILPGGIFQRALRAPVREVPRSRSRTAGGGVRVRARRRDDAAQGARARRYASTRGRRAGSSSSASRWRLLGLVGWKVHGYVTPRARRRRRRPWPRRRPPPRSPTIACILRLQGRPPARLPWLRARWSSTVLARRSSWVEAKVDGTTVLNRVLKEGESQRLEARQEVLLSVGNAGGIAVTLNDRASRTPRTGGRGEARHRHQRADRARAPGRGSRAPSPSPLAAPSPRPRASRPPSPSASPSPSPSPDVLLIEPRPDVGPRLARPPAAEPSSFSFCPRRCSDGGSGRQPTRRAVPEGRRARATCASWPPRARCPLKPADLVDLLQHLLARRRRGGARRPRTASLGGMPVDELLPDPQGPRDARRRSSPGPSPIARSASCCEVVLQNSSLPDEAVEALAATLPEHLAELVVINQVRLLRRTSLLEALESEPGPQQGPAPPPARAARDVPHRRAARAPPPPAAPAARRAPEPAAERGARTSWSTLTEEEADRAPARRGREAATTEKVSAVPAALPHEHGGEGDHAPSRASREERAILVRDPNRIVATAVLGSPRLTEPEIERFAGMKNVSDEVLRQIAQPTRTGPSVRGRLQPGQEPAHAPRHLAINIVPRLNPRDMKTLSVDTQRAGGDPQAGAEVRAPGGPARAARRRAEPWPTTTRSSACRARPPPPRSAAPTRSWRASAIPTASPTRWRRRGRRSSSRT